MQENTNKSITINSIILYTRLLIITVCGLLYTRFSLQALGINDYGLYSVVASIISFISIVNTTMLVTSNRYMAIAIGKNDAYEARCTFNVNLIIHVAIALGTLLLAIPLGHWYIGHHVTYGGDMADVRMIYDISVSASAISFMGVPYNGLLLARERFLVFCATDVLSSVFKLAVAYLLIDHFEEKLLIYALTMAFMTAFPTAVFVGYCRKVFGETVRLMLVRDRHRYADVLRFSLAIGYGAVATIAKTQGSALLINMFFSTALNAGLAVANSVSNMLQNFANNAQKPLTPQIMKNYASGHLDRSMRLVCVASKATYLVMLTISLPFLLIPETLLGLWLTEIPPYAVTFMRLLIADILVTCINMGIADYIFSTGKIKAYQITTNTILGLSVAAGYLILRSGMPPMSLFYVYIAFSLGAAIARQLILMRLSMPLVRALIRRSYIPSLTVTALCIPCYIARTWLSPWLILTMAFTVLLLSIYYLGLNSEERIFVRDMAKKAITKICPSRQQRN